jgi:glycine C-acetyltransferase
MGTFSKALGVMGGHVSGSRDMVDFAYNRSRSWLLSTATTPADLAACRAAIDVLESEPQHVKNLWKNTEYFKKILKDLGFNTGKTETPIIPVIVGDSAKARKFSSRLFDEGIMALSIVYPMVAKELARLRTQMNAQLTREDLDYSIEKIEKIGKELEVI